MKITIEHEGLTVSLEDKKAVKLTHVLDLMHGALVAVGFGLQFADEVAIVRDGRVEYVEEPPDRA